MSKRKQRQVIDFKEAQQDKKHYHVQREKNVNIIPRNTAQETYAAHLLNVDNRITFALGPAGTGKAQPLHSNIKTPSGWTTMGEIQVGDVVSTPDGGTANVIGLYPQGEKDIYKVTFADGRTAECCKEHLWNVYNYNWKNKWKVMSLDDIIKYYNDHPGNRGLKIQLPTPVDTPELEFPINPYALGALLGDGHLDRCLQFSTKDAEMVENLSESLGTSVSLSHTSKYDYNIIISDTHNSKTQCKKNVFRNPLKQKLYNLGLFGTRSHTKFIPDMYKHGSIQQKEQLIAGLVDTDGYVDKRTGSLSITTVSEVLANDIQEIIRSLGGIAKITSKVPTYKYLETQLKEKMAYTISIRYYCPNLLSNLTRKKELLPGENYQYKDLKLKIDTIEYSGSKEAQCIMIDHPDHLYITDNYVVTHNTYMAVLRAIQCLKQHEISRIVITRPAVSVDEQHGFLPGDLNQKMEPWTRPIMDVFEEYWSPEQIADMLAERVIEICPLAYMRGRTFKNAFIIADEMQNSTPEQMKMLLTRPGEGSYLAATGDGTQHDRGYEKNGLLDFTTRIDGWDVHGISVCHFKKCHVERDPIVEAVLTIYDDE